ncbi:MDR family MFS transporter [Weizmannia acidilactici]|nr:MFS transporter [Weizmannia acidilactici]
MAINITGSSFLWPLNSIYIHDHLGKTLSVAGVVLMLNSLASVIGSLAGGTLYDHIGGYRATMIGIVITVAALTGLTFWHGWPQYVIFLSLIGLGSGIIGPAMFAMAGSVWKNGGRKAYNAIYVAQNIGVAVGSALGGAIASYSFDYIFPANLLMFIVFGLIAAFGYNKMSKEQLARKNQGRTGISSGTRSQLLALIILCTSYLLCWIAYVQWQATISAYTQKLHISLHEYSLLWTLNGSIIVLGQPFLIPVTTKWLSNVKAQIMAGIAIFMVSFGVASIAEQFQGFVAAMAILTLGEMLVWPSVPAVAGELAPKGREGFYQGIVNSVATAGRMIGPVIGGLLADLYGMNVLFAVLIVLYAVALMLTAAYNLPLKSKKAEQSVPLRKSC